MDITFHLVPKNYFDALDPHVEYVPNDYSREGFIHCTDDAEEMARVANRYYKSVEGAHYYLYIDKARVRAPIRYDDALTQHHGTSIESKTKEIPSRDAASSKLYPHIYGALNRDAIVAMRAARRLNDGTFLPPEAL